MADHIRKHPYTKDALREMIRLAKELGFTDDVEHWTNELKKLEEEETV